VLEAAGRSKCVEFVRRCVVIVQQNVQNIKMIIARNAQLFVKSVLKNVVVLLHEKEIAT
jgi:hypothetical protein